MKTGGAMLLIALGLLALWVVVTGRLAQFERAWGVLSGAPGASGASPASGGSNPIGGALDDALNETLRAALGLPPKGLSSITNPSPFGTTPLPMPTFDASTFA